MSALSDIIANTPAGGTAALPAGEYEGPVVINKPLTLRGSSATVWSKHGSVIEVSSQGVTLEGLRVEITEGALSEPAITAKFPVNIRAVEVLGTVSGFGAEDGECGIPRALQLGELSPFSANAPAVKERLIYEAPQIARNAPLTAAAPAMAVNPEPADVISDVGAAPLSDEQLLELRKGQRVPAAGYLSGTVEVYLTGQRLGNADIDPYVFLLDENEKCRGEGDLVFFGNERSQDGAVRYYPDDGHISIDMAKLPPEVQRISVAYSVYSGDSVKNFSQVREPRVALFSQGKERVRFDIPGLTNEITIIAMEFYIYRGEWRISAVGAGYRDGLVKLCSRYGIQAST